MPWTCACPVEQRDDAKACASCGAVKEAWTLHADRTRSLVVTRQRLEVSRGGRFSTSGEGDLLVPATRAIALRKRAVSAMAAAGEAPPSGLVLALRLVPPKAGPARLLLEVQPAVGEPRQQELALDDGAAELRLVLVHGPLDEPTPLDALPGHRTVDVSDGSPAGHAARLRLSIQGRAPVGLPICGEPAAWLAARLSLLLDRPSGLTELLRREVCHLRPLDAEGPAEEVTTDAAGVLRHEVAAPGRWALEVRRGEQRLEAELSTGPAGLEPLEVCLSPDDPSEGEAEPCEADSPGEVDPPSHAGGAS